ncbi:MAG TPA: fasciclin domain-containing protein [Acidimicrobiia bacterium]|nr:fasciclin domain-containing protein [Acidimicrobiia bacterium]
MISSSRRLAYLLALLALVAAACGGSAATTTTAAPATTTTEEMTDEEMMGDVLEVAAAEGDLGVFLDALGAAGIMDDFHGEGPFTLFIPTDEAFSSYLEEAGMSQEEVFAGAEMLQAILNFHIVNMVEDGEMVMGMSGESFTTASGEALEVTVDGDVVMVGGATIERYDIEASNGVIHVIDTVLIPPTA